MFDCQLLAGGTLLAFTVCTFAVFSTVTGTTTDTWTAWVCNAWFTLAVRTTLAVTYV